MGKTTFSLAVYLLIHSLASDSEAKAVIGFATTGATSHQAAIARIGVELVARGHDFALLLSTEDHLTNSRLSHGQFQSVRVVNFTGPAKLGHNEWLNELPRDPQEVRPSSRC